MYYKRNLTKSIFVIKPRGILPKLIGFIRENLIKILKEIKLLKDRKKDKEKVFFCYKCKKGHYANKCPNKRVNELEC